MTTNYLTQRVNTWISVALVAAVSVWAGYNILDVAENAEEEFQELHPEERFGELLE